MSSVKFGLDLFTSALCWPEFSSVHLNSVQFSTRWKLATKMFLGSLSSQGDDDEDDPMISGFSDDVPMVIA